MNKISRCRLCGNKNLVEVCNLGEQALTGYFPANKTDAEIVSPLTLLKCLGDDVCGLVQLSVSCDPEQMYGLDYGYRSGLNSSMVEHLQIKVNHILELNCLEEGDIVLDIGSNDGTTLNSYPENLKLKLVGIDPTISKFKHFYKSNIIKISDFFSATKFQDIFGTDEKAKIITSFSMFYDLEDPLNFAKEIRSILHPGGIWVFEQSYLPNMLEANSFDTVCHEHLEYYGVEQIQWLVEACDMKIIDLQFNSINGGSFSAAVTHVDNLNHHAIDLSKFIENEKEKTNETSFESFNKRIDNLKEEFKRFIKTCQKNNYRVGGLGASTKGNVLLQYYGLSVDSMYAVGEVNEDKVGKFTPSTHIPIMSEDDVIKSCDYLIVLPWHFKQFFINKFSGSNVKLVFPLPEFEIIET